MPNKTILFLFIIAAVKIHYLPVSNIITAKEVKISAPPNIPDTLLTPLQVTHEITRNMIFVDSGTFLMGSDYRHPSDWPLTNVHIDQFHIDKYEITQKEWRGVMGDVPNSFQNCPNCPVEGVSWNDAILFIAKLNQVSCKHFRLPTEAEWEYAEKGGNKGHNYKYSGSDNLQEVAWFSENAEKNLHVVGQKKPNQLGIYDMTGNVSEWCNDWYDINYYKYIPHNNPQGPLKGTEKVIRGANFQTNRSEIWPAMHAFDNPCVGHTGLGFRIVEDL
jgi:formylglycine-generating enzyme required for sulfatase activity